MNANYLISFLFRILVYYKFLEWWIKYAHAMKQRNSFTEIRIRYANANQYTVTLHRAHYVREEEYDMDNTHVYVHCVALHRYGTCRL